MTAASDPPQSLPGLCGREVSVGADPTGTHPVGVRAPTLRQLSSWSFASSAARSTPHDLELLVEVAPSPAP